MIHVHMHAWKWKTKRSRIKTPLPQYTLQAGQVVSCRFCDSVGVPVSPWTADPGHRRWLVQDPYRELLGVLV